MRTLNYEQFMQSNTKHKSHINLTLTHGHKSRGNSWDETPEFGMGYVNANYRSPDFQKIPLSIHQNTPYYT